VNVYGGLIGGHNPDAMTALAGQLRQRSNRAKLAMLSGDPVLMKLGQSELASTEAHAKEFQDIRQKKIDRDAIKGRHEGLMAWREAQAKAADDKWAKTYALDKDRNRAREQYEKGRLEVERLKAMNAHKKTKNLPNHWVKRLESAGEQNLAIDRLSRKLQDPDFNPGFLYVPGGRNIANWAAREGIGTREAEEVQQWWNEFERMWNIPKRYEKFGATLTNNERIAWKHATINENMGKDQIELIMGIIKKYARWNSERLQKSVLASGNFDRDEILFLLNDHSDLDEDPGKSNYDLPNEEMKGRQDDHLELPNTWADGPPAHFSNPTWDLNLKRWVEE
jgi:hypothetical protein